MSLYGEVSDAIDRESAAAAKAGFARRRRFARQSLSATVESEIAKRSKSNSPFATEDDLIAVREYLVGELQTAKHETAITISTTVVDLRNELKDLHDHVSSQLAAAAEARAEITLESSRVAHEFAQVLQKEIDGARICFDDQIKHVRDFVELKHLETQAIGKEARERLREAMATADAQLQASLDERLNFTQLSIDDHRHELEGLLNDLRNELTSRVDTEARHAAEALAKVSLGQLERDAVQDEFIKSSILRMSGLQDDVSAAISCLATSSEAKLSEAESTLQKQAKSLKMRSDERMNSIESKARATSDRLAEVESVSTRRVEWLVNDATARFAGSGNMSLLSPKFGAAGARNLQLEIRIIPQREVSVANGIQTASQRVGNLGQPGSLVEDCEVLLWASDAALRLIFKLFLGNAWVQLDHVFDGLAGSCPQSFGCLLKDQIRRQDDSLLLGLEILEVIREIHDDRGSSMSPTRENDSFGERLDGTITLYRYHNHRTLDLVRDQVDLMRSRMVRRVGWCLEQASTLRSLFPEGKCVCSATFEAAGVSGLQLVFYPSGIAGVREGFCSFFLHCAAGSSLRFWLQAGKQRREARLDSDRAGVHGRTNFCRFENCIDTSDDTVQLVLEIEEAQQSETLLPRDVSEASARRPTQLPFGQSFPAEESRLSSLERSAGGGTIVLGKGVETADDSVVQGKVKLLRSPGKVALEDVRQLPSIWTPRPLIDVAEALAGFQTFADLKPVRKPSSSRPTTGRRCIVSDLPVPAAGTLAPLSARPASPGSRRYVMYAAT
eukprot:TRINITY_DN17071_c0_g1_i2.p1 TRINITY_DN17071_c0_g1~~TRINITY_DN17071_c0_g1_i2.p1  ORF type:complete len:785 (-),score=121.63 TRINITY_DN17071_c0_g1_i2:145-2499(-)